MNSAIERNKRLIAVLCCTVCAVLVWWYCYNFQRSIVIESLKHGMQDRDITRVSLKADADAATNHALQGRAIAEGRILPFHLSVFEHRDRIILHNVIPRLIIGSAYILTGNIDKAYNYILIFGPVAASIVVFIMLYYITRSSFFSTTFTLGIIILQMMPDRFPDIAPLRKYLFSIAKMNKIYISRGEAPAVTYFFYALAMFYIFWLDKKQQDKAWFFIGLTSGLLSLVYLFHFLYVAIFCGLLLLARMIMNKKFDVKLFSYFIGGFALGILPFLMLYLQAATSSWFADYSSRIHFEVGRVWRSHRNGKIVTAVIMTGISIFLYMRARITQRDLFLWSACLFMVKPVLLNIQLILGRVPEADHLERYGTVFGEWLAFAFLAYGLSIWFKEIYKEKRKLIFLYSHWIIFLIMSSLIFSSLLWISFAPVNRAKLVWKSYVRPEGERPLMEWINKNTPSQTVFLTTDMDSVLRIVAVTGRYSFIAITNTALTNEEIEERLLLGFKILGLSFEQLREYLNNNHPLFFASRYLPTHIGSSFVMGQFPRTIPERKFEELKDRFNRITFSRELLSKGPKLNYILVSSAESNTVDINILTKRFGFPIYENKEYLIFKYDGLVKSPKMSP